ncbi:RloB domain-containing protein [Yinghuangia aomiensis]
MLLSFRVANHLSIREEQQLNLTPVYDDGVSDQLGAERCVPVAAVFGPNAAGKSNLIDALRWMARMVRGSHREAIVGGGVNRQPFLLDTASREIPRGTSPISPCMAFGTRMGSPSMMSASPTNGCTPTLGTGGGSSSSGSWTRSHSAKCGSPRQIVGYAQQLRDRDCDAFDEVWCVVDVDEFKDISAAVGKAAGAGIEIAISNPCFELWLILHFGDHTAPCTSYGTLSPYLKKHVPDYDKSKLRFRDFAGGLDAAHQRAVRLDPTGKEHRRNPSTGVRRLVQAMRSGSGTGQIRL